MVESEAIVSRRLISMLHDIRRDAVSPSHVEAFERGRLEQPVLQSFFDSPSVLEDLANRAVPYPTRDAITRSLIAQRQRSHHILWASLLIAAYAPMLARLRWRISTSSVSSADLDQFLLVSFLEAVEDFDITSNKPVAVRLKHKTRELFMTLVQREQGVHAREVEVDASVEDEEPLNVAASNRNMLPEDDRKEEMCFSLDSATKRGEPVGNVRLVVCTLLESKPLRTQVSPALSGNKHRRAYERLKRQHSRITQRLRLVFSDESRGEQSTTSQCGGMNS